MASKSFGNLPQSGELRIRHTNKMDPCVFLGGRSSTAFTRLSPLHSLVLRKVAKKTVSQDLDRVEGVRDRVHESCSRAFPRILRRGMCVALRPTSSGTTRALPLTRALCRGGAAKAKLNTAPTASNAEENKKKAAAQAQKRADARDFMKRANSGKDAMGEGSADSPGGHHHHHHHHHRRPSQGGDISAQFQTLRPEDCEFPEPCLSSQPNLPRRHFDSMQK